MNNDKVTLKLSVEEVNIILKALGDLPFNQVYDLIGNIHEQANQQLFGIETENEKNQISFNKEN